MCSKNSWGAYAAAAGRYSGGGGHIGAEDAGGSVEEVAFHLAAVLAIAHCEYSS
jgi:hypothetical protein